MGAATGTALWPGSSTFPSTGVYPGQGNAPIVRCRFSFDDASDPTPSWSEVANSDFRSFNVSRGRENELATIDAGTASVVLDDRDRAYDPTNSIAVKPMNRVWLYEEFSGEVHSIFRGYVESWEPGWANGGWSDATATANCTDEFKVLALLTVPTTSPPRASYEDVIGSDTPVGYWRLNEDPASLVQTPTDSDPNPNPFDPNELGRWADHFRRQGWE